jgi:O-antigen/teichoic acid export membrane protein
MEPDTHRAVRGTASLAAAQVLARAASLGFALVATRVLAPAQLGRYAFITAVVFLGGAVADFGTTALITRRTSHDPESASANLAVGLPASAALGLVAYIAVVGFVAVTSSQETLIDAAIGGFSLVPGSIVTTLFGTMDGVGLISRRAALTAVQQAGIPLATSAVLLATPSARDALAAFALVPVATLAITCVVVVRHGLWPTRFTTRGGARFLGDALPYALIAGVGVISLRFDYVLLEVIKGRSAVGLYEPAMKTSEAFFSIIGATAAPLLFLFTRRLASGDTPRAQASFDRANRILPALAVVVCIPLAFGASDIVRVAFGSDYGRTAAPLAILLCQMPLALLTSVGGSLVAATGAPLAAVANLLVSSAIRVAFAVPLIVRFGPTGAAVAVGIGQGLNLVALSAFNRKRARLRTRLPFRAAAAAGVALLVGIAARNALTSIEVSALVLAVAVVMVAATHALTASELRTLWHQSRSDRQAD